jgi:hypothetical protein
MPVTATGKTGSHHRAPESPERDTFGQSGYQPGWQQYGTSPYRYRSGGPNHRPGRTFLDPYRLTGQKRRAASAAPQAGQARTTTPARGCLAELHPQPAHASLPRAAQNDHYGMVRHDIGGNPTADHNQAGRRAIIYRLRVVWLPRHGPTRERMSVCLFIGALGVNFRICRCGRGGDR